MRIGIDIDDTITNTWENSLKVHSELFGVPVSEMQKSLPYYNAVKHVTTLAEYYTKIKTVIDEVAKNVPIKKDAKEIINKLKAEGHTIIIITARDNRAYIAPYEVSKNYLDNHQIKYDKLIIGAENKAAVAKKEEIDLFIDDSIKHCSSVADSGIDVLLYETYYNRFDTRFIHMKDWYQIYDYIKDRCQDGRRTNSH